MQVSAGEKNRVGAGGGQGRRCGDGLAGEAWLRKGPERGPAGPEAAGDGDSESPWGHWLESGEGGDSTMVPAQNV